jgi:hypothetical protein
MRGLAILAATAVFMMGGADVGSAGKVDGRVRVTLVGASIGQQWNFDHLNERVPVGDYRFEYVGMQAFDKSEVIAGIATRRHKPDVVLIKECATYFRPILRSVSGASMSGSCSCGQRGSARCW